MEPIVFVILQFFCKAFELEHHAIIPIFDVGHLDPFLRFFGLPILIRGIDKLTSLTAAPGY